MKKKLITAFFAIILPLLVLTGCGCKHEWVDATCTAPKTCSKCQETEGEALGHTEGDWKRVKVDVDNLLEVSVKHCIVCDAELDKQTTTLKSLRDDEFFLIYPSEFVERFGMMLDNADGVDYSIEAVSYVGDWFLGYVLENDEAVGQIMFVNDVDYEGGFIKFDDVGKTRFNGVTIDYCGSELELFMAALLMTFYPDLSPSAAFEVGAELLANGVIVYGDLPLTATMAENGQRFFSAIP